MPRVTFDEFYARHKQLRKAWKDPISYFLSLDAHEQNYLHDYYRPSEKLTKKELREHWKSLHERSTPLHQQAGRAYSRLRPYLEGEPYCIVEPEKRAKSSKNADTIIRGTVHPQLDVELMTEAVMILGEQLHNEATKHTN